MQTVSRCDSRWKRVFVLTLLSMASAFPASAQTLTTLHTFTFDDGAMPAFATPTQGRDGNIFATTSVGGSNNNCLCGTVFNITPGGTLTSVGFEGADGAIPDAGLVLGNDGLLYGTASFGGASGNGEVFRWNGRKGTLTVLHSFSGSDGASPQTPLTLGPGGKFYGTTNTGGANNLGTVFSMKRSGSITTLHSFSAADGQNPLGAGLTVGLHGDLYSVTSGGGNNGFGTIFKITASGTFTKLYDFDQIHGANPHGSLLLAADGNMYGTTNAGGGLNLGVVFKVTPTGIVTVLHSFDSIDGASPESGLMQGSDGKLYGTTFFGGINGNGTIFSITTGGTLTTIYNFPGFYNVDGANPYGLMQYTDGKLYGMTSQGGVSNNCDDFGATGCGTMFSLDLGLRPFVQLVDSSGKVGSVIQILGTDLTGTTAVSFNGVPASTFTVVHGTFMEAMLPAGATTGPLTVTTPTGTLTSNVNFTVLP
jgi:uncharacterized repeat protein (TIGR03803 family)